MHSFYYLGDSKFYAIMRDKTWTPYLMKSTDGGVNWDIMNPKGWLRNGGKLHFLNENDGIVLITPDEYWGRSLILQTHDGGYSWTYQHFTYSISGIQLFNKNEGVIYGGGGGFHGFNWGYMSNMTEGRLFQVKYEGSWINKCYFIDDMTGFVVVNVSGREYSHIHKTTDGGMNWRAVVDSLWMGGNDFYLSDEKHGWIVGSGIYETTDLGEQWELIQTYPGTEDDLLSLYSVFGYDTTVWTVGEQGLMVKYTPQKQWQQKPSVTDLPLKDVFFSDEQHGWIAGGYLNGQENQSVTLKTDDGGDNWTKINMPNYMINDMYFDDNLHGWAVGYDTSYFGMILESWDGGDSWDVQIADLSAPLNALHFNNGVGWAVGGNGLVLRTDNWTTWIDQNTGEVYSTKYNLSQNYPNPFNPTTMIKFTLPQANRVKIYLYNTLGQKVKTILDKRMTAGDHEIEFEAQNIASGVYYYRIEAGEFQDVKKMILLR
jgi:photosystem II stability/assembly factor-like uncharacterized protein